MSLLHPDQPLRCLLINTRFSEFSYWNYRIACEAMGAKCPSAPLGLITVAALLPQRWDFKLLDLNARDFSQEDWDWAQVICIGGMLPQQKSMLDYIQRGRDDGKYVVCGGADPSSQPDLYTKANVVVVGEGETAIPMWLDSWRAGQPDGRFTAKEKPDVTKSPIPRFDLLRFKDYLQIGVQLSRGCPFNCEFCDIIELFGRVPRSKTEDQFMAELDTLYNLGYRGSVEFVDDNFIGNKRLVKRKLLPAIIAWQKKRRYPFYFHTEASMNIADDKELLGLMRDAEFRFIFMGIESPDPEILKQTQKAQNVLGDISKRIQVLYDFGLVIFGGFILGFDSEKKGMDRSMIKLVEDANIAVAMVGLLVALPNTQLTRRLLKEGRLCDLKGQRLEAPMRATGGSTIDAVIEVVDQTTAGLNFVTKRPRIDILEEFASTVRYIYDPKVYADRVLRTVRALSFRPRHVPPPKEAFRLIRAFRRQCMYFTKRKTSRWQFWRVVLCAIPLGPFRFDVAMRLMGIYLHLENQTAFVLNNVKEQIEFSKKLIQNEIAESMKQAASLAKPKSIPRSLPSAEVGIVHFG